MTTYQKTLLTGSTDGMLIPVTATGTPGTLIHTAVASSASFDEIFIYANNVGGADVVLTIEWGGTTNPDDLIVFTVPSKDGKYLIASGELLRNSKAVRAYADTSGSINIGGYVNRITS